LLKLLEANANLTPAQQQQRAAEQFSAVVAKSHMEMLPPEEVLPAQGAKILIGVASYSIPDLEMLDAIEARLSREPIDDETIHLFDVSALPDSRDFEKYLPGIGRVYQTPVIGLWQNGVLQDKASGTLARHWLTQRYGLLI
jgi:hypothetical protein